MWLLPLPSRETHSSRVERESRQPAARHTMGASVRALPSLQQALRSAAFEEVADVVAVVGDGARPVGGDVEYAPHAARPLETELKAERERAPGYPAHQLHDARAPHDAAGGSAIWSSVTSPAFALSSWTSFTRTTAVKVSRTTADCAPGRPGPGTASAAKALRHSRPP